MKKKSKGIWFPAKKYGYGWGLPVTWQGWAITLSYLLIVIGGSFTLTDTPRSKKLFLVFVFVLSMLFVYICFKKGEKPKWRWGDNN